MNGAIESLFIPDTSVVIKWLVKETEDHDEIQAMKRDFLDKRIRLIIPAFCIWELSNYLGRTFSEEMAIEKLSYFRGLRWQEALLNIEVAFIAFKIMKKNPAISFYDASFHALAIQMNGTLITSDEKYYSKTKKMGAVQLLADYREKAGH